MAKGVDKGFTQGLNRKFQLLFPQQANDLTTYLQVIHEESNASIKHIEEVALCEFAIYKYVFRLATKTSHAKFYL